MIHIRPISRLSNHFSAREFTRPQRLISTSSLLNLRESENFTFDWSKVKSTVDQEREAFLRHKEMFRTDQDTARKIVHQKRKYSVSQNPEEWKYVERLISQAKPKSTPVPEVHDSTPASSGFVMPTAKHGDYPYHVKRAPSWMLPVYVSQPIKNGQPQSTITVIRRVEGDVAALREELSEFLFEKYEQEFISQANELMQKVVFRGNFDADFKEFLKMKGF